MYTECWVLMYIISSLDLNWCSVACAISFSILENKWKKMSKRDYMEIWILFNAWLFAYIWPRPVSYKLPRIFNGSQENSSFDFITLAFLNHFNCSNEMLHSEQPSTNNTAILPIWMGKPNKKNRERFTTQNRICFWWSFDFELLWK